MVAKPAMQLRDAGGVKMRKSALILQLQRVCLLIHALAKTADFQEGLL